MTHRRYLNHSLYFSHRYGCKYTRVLFTISDNLWKDLYGLKMFFPPSQTVTSVKGSFEKIRQAQIIISYQFQTLQTAFFDGICLVKFIQAVCICLHYLKKIVIAFIDIRVSIFLNHIIQSRFTTTLHHYCSHCNFFYLKVIFRRKSCLNIFNLRLFYNNLMFSSNFLRNP